MMDFYVDQYVRELWNENNPSERLYDENFWDMCRYMEGCGLLDSDKVSVAAVSIGPFKIASKLELTKKDSITFFITNVIPWILVHNNDLSFNEVYITYLIPAINILVKLTSSLCIVKEQLEWELLLYVDRENKANKYPAEVDIMKDENFRGFEDYQIKEALLGLQNYKNLIGDTVPLIRKDKNETFVCEI